MTAEICIDVMAAERLPKFPLRAPLLLHRMVAHHENVFAPGTGLKDVVEPFLIYPNMPVFIVRENTYKTAATVVKIVANLRPRNRPIGWQVWKHLIPCVLPAWTMPHLMIAGRGVYGPLEVGGRIDPDP